MSFAAKKKFASLLAMALILCIGDLGNAGKKKGKPGYVEILTLDLGETGVEFTLELETEAVAAGEKHMVPWLDSASEDGFLVIDATALKKKGWFIEERDTASRLSGYVIFSTGHSLRDPNEKRWNYKRLMVLLSAFDDNKDRKIDKQDPIYPLLGVFRDANSNGKIDSGEVSTLAALEIAAIKLFVSGKTKDAFNNLHQFFKVEKTDGSTTQAHLVRISLKK